MLKLCYFNGRGLAETSRMILAVAGAEYEDFRYPLEVIDWATFNMVRRSLTRIRRKVSWRSQWVRFLFWL